ncbi:hypothetical protein DM860_003018 [Cuscuta australis]|uniref:Protein kinase domain-containing protein n=1 Tax=Cuscuta australis TaxID=267555 RepID=A0A328D155_9ASTE|nr:hypothetical protein DM860_003018 [Cuscuta australis]
MRKNPLKSSKSSVNEARTSGRYDDDARPLASSSIARNISMKSGRLNGVGGSKQKMIVEDVLRYGEMRVEAEVFTFCELAKATDNFNPDLLLGEGGFGRIYKGHIRRTNKAKPLLNDREKFRTLADPLLVGNYPTKGMYQALAVAAMCLQDEANTRPLIGDIVSALEYLATPDEEWNGTADGDGVECLLVPKDKNASTTLE